MSLYHVQFDGSSFWIEADNFAQAVEAWKAHVKALGDAGYMPTDEPESVHFVHDEPVIRRWGKA